MIPCLRTYSGMPKPVTRQYSKVKSDLKSPSLSPLLSTKMSIKEIHNMDPKYKQYSLFEESFVELEKHVKEEKLSVQMNALAVKLYYFLFNI